MNFKSENITINPNNVPIINSKEQIIVLEKKIALLNKICNEINPYQNLSDQMKTDLQSFGILDFSNPFKLTNTLVLLLEDAIEELHQLKPFNFSDESCEEKLSNEDL
jgi:hypothetical protein